MRLSVPNGWVQSPFSSYFQLEVLYPLSPYNTPLICMIGTPFLSSFPRQDSVISLPSHCDAITLKYHAKGAGRAPIPLVPPTSTCPPPPPPRTPPNSEWNSFHFRQDTMIYLLSYCDAITLRHPVKGAATAPIPFATPITK